MEEWCVSALLLLIFYVMNIRFNGNLNVVPGKKMVRGINSEAAKQAFHDILQDESMRVYVEYLGVEYKARIILNESILEEP